MGQLAVYDMLYPSLYTFAIHLYTKEPYNAAFYKFNSRFNQNNKADEDFGISQGRTRSTQWRQILKSADRMRLLEKDNWRRKFVDFMNFDERFLLNYNELDLQTSAVT